MKVHHIGYLVKDINLAIESFFELGYTVCDDTVCDNDRNIHICFMTNGDTCIELISPISQDSPVSKMLKKQGAGPYHICYETPNLEKEIEVLCQKGYMLIQPPAPAVAFLGKPVAFLYKKNIGIMELVQV